MATKPTWKIITIIEFTAIVAVVLLDLFIPTLVILVLMAVSLLIRREHIAVMGFKRPRSWLARWLVTRTMSWRTPSTWR